MSNLGRFQRNNAGVLVRNGKIFLTGNQGGVSVEELYEALRYSGLVTADMTADEMLAALAAAYPATASWLMSGWTYNTDKGTAIQCTLTANSSKVDFILGQQTDLESAQTAYAYSPYIDLTPFKTLTILGTSMKATANASNFFYAPEIELVPESGSAIDLYQQADTSQSNVTQSINVVKDVSTFTGKYCLRFRIGDYRSTGNANGQNVGAYIKLTKALLTA